MHEFALLFRRRVPIEPAEVPALNAAARTWALALRDRGLLRTASPLEEDGRVVSAHGVGPVADPAAIASVLVIEAESLAAAVALTQGHPGLAHGVEIEVRPVKIVAPPPR